jgi:hypothetical protein
MAPMASSATSSHSTVRVRRAVAISVERGSLTVTSHRARGIQSYPSVEFGVPRKSVAAS